MSVTVIYLRYSATHSLRYDHSHYLLLNPKQLRFSA